MTKNKHISKTPTGAHADAKTYMTPHGYQVLSDELDSLLRVERPKIVETVRWAAGNGDRSENGDYIYGKKRLREIDRRVRYLTKRIENAHIVSSDIKRDTEKVFFGACVTYLENETIERTVTIVGIDEADTKTNKISYLSPVAKALLKSAIGDCVNVHTPDGILELEILTIRY